MAALCFRTQGNQVSKHIRDVVSGLAEDRPQARTRFSQPGVSGTEPAWSDSPKSCEHCHAVQIGEFVSRNIWEDQLDTCFPSH